jgi:hypothetical protein
LTRILAEYEAQQAAADSGTRRRLQSKTNKRRLQTTGGTLEEICDAEAGTTGLTLDICLEHFSNADFQPQYIAWVQCSKRVADEIE